MSIKKVTGYAFFKLVDDKPDKLPKVYKTKKECVADNRSYFGHPCDDPEKRGVIAKVEMIFHVPKQIEMSQDLLDYIHGSSGRPAIQIVGDDVRNAQLLSAAVARGRRLEQKARKLMGSK